MSNDFESYLAGDVPVGEVIVSTPQRYVVIDAEWGVVLSEPMSFDEARTEMAALATSPYIEHVLGIDEYRGQGQGEETGTSFYDHPESWTTRRTP